MITVKLMGGMGNQMFQYAFGLAQARRLWVGLQLDTTVLGGHRPYQLQQWGIDVPLVERITPTIREQGMPYNPKLVEQIKNGDCLEGYWQSEKYFESIRINLRTVFSPKDGPSIRAEALYSDITKPNSVAVHIRRGDYLLEPHKSFHGVLGWEYYKAGMNYIRERVENPKFFFFSDEPEWVREHFYTDFSLGEQIVVESGLEAEDIYMMALCSHSIIANSSFSWWGGWLGNNQDRIVIAPKKWFNTDIDTSDLIPDRWVRL
jgi:hypothetical protein